MRIRNDFLGFYLGQGQLGNLNTQLRAIWTINKFVQLFIISDVLSIHYLLDSNTFYPYLCYTNSLLVIEQRTLLEQIPTLDETTFVRFVKFILEDVDSERNSEGM